MKTPVLIAARNEQAGIARLLTHLPADTVEPVVIANGCIDDTASVAREFGATVIEREMPGKMPALQHGLRYVAASRSIAHTSILFTDADSWPVTSRAWISTMRSSLEGTGADPGQPRLTVGPLVYRLGAGFPSNVARTVLNSVRQTLSLGGVGIASWPGANMGLYLTDPYQHEAIQDIPHYWPGEDRAIRDTVVSLGGIALFCPHPALSVYTESRYAQNFFQQFAHPKPERRRRSLAHYQMRAAEGARPYDGDVSFAPEVARATADLG